MNKKKALDAIALTLFFIIEEIIFKTLVNNLTLDYSLLRISVYSALLGTLIASLANISKNKKIQNLILILSCIISTIYSLAQLGFLEYFGIYMSINTGGQIGAVKSYILDFIKSIKPIYYTLLIPIIPIIIYCILNKTKQEKKGKKEICITLLTLLMLSIVYYSTINIQFMQNKYQAISNKELFNYPTNPSAAVNQFGINGFLLLDIKTLFHEKEELTYEVPKETITITNKYFDDTIWKNIIENEKSSTNNTLNNYYISQNQTKENNYTGYFKDKNVIMIMLESVNTIALNKEYFPTLYKLYSEGWSWENNYSPRNTCPTGNNEFSALTSLYSINNTCVARDYKNNSYYESIFNLFKNKGYTVTSYHNYTEQYYPRSTIHKNLGSTYYGPKELEIKTSSNYGTWPSDVELIEKAFPLITSNNKFFAFMTTVTSHAPYNKPSEYGDKYLSKFEDLDVSIDLKRYLSKLTEVDLALQTLLENLEKTKKLDDTVIVLFGDHYPYAINTNNLNDILGEINNVDIDKTPFIIYNSKITAQKHTEYTSYINILPTLANLFDLNYDARLYMGEDLLNEDYQSIVIFPNGSWKNEKAYYNANNNKITYSDPNETYTDQEIVNINKIVLNKLQISTQTIKKNYFNYLKEKYEENGIDNPLDLYITETYEKEV